jgi:hypothetical protein
MYYGRGTSHVHSLDSSLVKQTKQVCATSTATTAATTTNGIVTPQQEQQQQQRRISSGCCSSEAQATIDTLLVGV